MSLNEICKKILKLAYEYESKEARPYQFGSDDKNLPFPITALRDEIPFLVKKGYIIENVPYLSVHAISLTEKGEQYVENHLLP